MKRPSSLEGLNLADDKFDFKKESRRWKEPPSKALRASQIEMKSSSLEDEMTSDAIQTLSDALDKGGIENDIATYMKSTFEKKYARLRVEKHHFGHLEPEQKLDYETFLCHGALLEEIRQQLELHRRS